MVSKNGGAGGWTQPFCASGEPPLGFAIDTAAKQPYPVPPIESFVSRRLTSSFWTPLNVTFAFCPGTVVVTEPAGPPGVIDAVASAGTSYSWSVSEPVAASVGSTVIV